MEKIAGDLLLGSKITSPNTSIHFLYHRLGELKLKSLDHKGLMSKELVGSFIVSSCESLLRLCLQSCS